MPSDPATDRPPPDPAATRPPPGPASDRPAPDPALPERQLDEHWRAAVADEDLRRVYHGADFEDSGWEALTVPGHWRSAPTFAASDGPILHRCRFDAPAPGPGRRAWLTFDGLFYQGDVWLDGTYLGDTEGYFVPHTFEVTDQLRDRSAHALAVEVTCARERTKTAKRNLTGAFQHWPGLDPTWNPGGIWRPVRLTQTGPVRIDRLRVLCRDASTERAVVAFRATLDSDEPRTVCVRTALGALDHEVTQPLAAGANVLEWAVTVERPDLWWPRALGEPVLHDVTVAVALRDGNAADPPLSDVRRLRTGLRTVRLRRWICSVNGERLFLKGANQGPSRMALGHASAEELRADVGWALDAGLDLLRLHAHVSRPELYDAADERGLLLWQDMPLQWGYARGARKPAVRLAREAVDLLGHHPSIAVWCGHNEPMAIDTGAFAAGEPGAAAALARRALRAQQLPSWNRTVLDGSIKRALHKADGTRAVIPHSGVLPHLPQLDGTDSHLYFGWYWGDERDLPGFARAAPRMVRFVSEFGAQAVPSADATGDGASFCQPARWPDLDWRRLGERHNLQKARFDRYVPPAGFATFDGWREATQRYQAELIRRHIEALRRLKYRPSGGFAQFCLADGHPGVTWSVLDHERRPKLGYAALRDACRPVIVVADRMPPTLRPGQALALDIHVVSDLRVDLDGARVTARLEWPGGEHVWRWGGDIPADSCLRVATLQAVVPEAEGVLTLGLELHLAAGDVVGNRYEALIGEP
jgi:beta-mannosidase